MQAVLAGPIHQLLLQLLTLAVTAVLATVGHRVVVWLDAHTTAQQRWLLAEAARAAVLWAEQFGGATGADKFKAAVATVERTLGRAGLSLTEVEAAVQAAYAQAVHDGLLTAHADQHA